VVCEITTITRFKTVRFGSDLTFVALSGETCVDYSLRLKREFGGPGALWVAGYSNDILAYIPSRRVLLEGGYEAFRSLMYWSNPLHPDKFADTLEERIIGKVGAMLPIRVAVTGAAGQIGYALLFRIASGAMFGPTSR
jgi:hypothetical protein